MTKDYVENISWIETAVKTEEIKIIKDLLDVQTAILITHAFAKEKDILNRIIKQKIQGHKRED